MNDAGSIVWRWSPRNLCEQTHVGVHRFRDDQCLSTHTGGMAAESLSRGTIQSFLVGL